MNGIICSDSQSQLINSEASILKSFPLPHVPEGVAAW
jgi:hypothetical protein